MRDLRRLVSGLVIVSFSIAALLLCLVVLVILGLTLPAPLETLLNEIVRIVAR